MRGVRARSRFLQRGNKGAGHDNFLFRQSQLVNRENGRPEKATIKNKRASAYVIHDAGFTTVRPEPPTLGIGSVYGVCHTRSLYI